MSSRDEHQHTWDEDQCRRLARFFDLLRVAELRLRAGEDEPARRSPDTASGGTGSPCPRPEGTGGHGL